MSLSAAHVRSLTEMTLLKQEIEDDLENFFDRVSCSRNGLPHALKTRDMLIVQKAVLSAMLLTGKDCQSRGSALMLSENGVSPAEKLEQYRYLPGTGSRREFWVRTENGTSSFEAVRPLPRTDDWFETVWAEYDARRNTVR